MVRKSCLAGLAAALAAAFCAQAAPDQGRVHARTSAVRHHAQSAPLLTPVFVGAVVAGYGYGYSYGYGSSYAYAPRTQLYPQLRAPSLFYIGPLAANAPPFHIDNAAGDEAPSWNWERVSLQQLVAEVRARRETAATGQPVHRQYCPDSRAYYPEVTQCASEWLTVVGKAPAATRSKNPQG